MLENLTYKEFLAFRHCYDKYGSCDANRTDMECPYYNQQSTQSRTCKLLTFLTHVLFTPYTFIADLNFVSQEQFEKLQALERIGWLQEKK